MEKREYEIQDLLEDESFVSWTINPKGPSNEHWSNWIDGNKKRFELASDAKDIILSMKFNDGQLDEVDHVVWNKIEQTITMSNDRLKPDGKQVFWSYKKWMSVAAIFILVSLLSFLAYQNYQPSEDELITNVEIISKENAFGVKSQIRLPDGTKVWLSSGSKLSYPSTFNQKSRNVELNGQAFFEVISNKKKPFIVQTPYFATTVLGTSFCINVHEEKESRISLVEGKVKVSKLGSDQVITAGQQVTFDKGQMVIQSFDYDREIAWKEGILYFKKENVGDVMKELEKWYGVKIDFDLSAMPDSRYSGRHNNQSLETVLEGMSYSLNFKYQINKNDISILFN
ncbi:MAG: FecR family protein [Cyclobacteriaceae bacterium]